MKQKGEHYVNNRDFSDAVMQYVKTCNEARQNKQEIPIIPRYIGECFIRICTGLAHKGNFSGYSYRDEMILDALENCVKAINNYNIDASTRTGRPNAFSYFTQITYFAFLRRIAKEKRQEDIRQKCMENAGIDDSFSGSDEDSRENASMLEEVKSRTASYRKPPVSVKKKPSVAPAIKSVLETHMI